MALGEALLPVGTLYFEARHDKQMSTFRYSESWLESAHAFAIAPTLPLGSQPSFASAPTSDSRDALPGVFSDCAPDSWGRRLVERDVGGHPTELDYLLAANDRTRQGALRFLDDDGVALAADTPPVPGMAKLADFRRLAQAFETGKTADIQRVAHELRGAGSALGGARPKCDFEDDNGVLCLAKFTSTHDDLPVERMEVAALRLAGEVGLRVASADLAMQTSRYPVALIRRFDRRGERRLHYASARTFLGKHGSEHGYYSDLADTMRSTCGGSDALLAELRELHRRILFSILVSNDDDHLKNHGFLYVGGGAWKLSPAFDINPSVAGSAHLQTGISELSGYEASVEAAIEAAPLFDVETDDAWNDARQMATTITARWRPLCMSLGMDAHECDAYGPAFERAAVQCGADRPTPPPRAGSVSPPSRSA